MQKWRRFLCSSFAPHIEGLHVSNIDGTAVSAVALRDYRLTRTSLCFARTQDYNAPRTDRALVAHGNNLRRHAFL